MPRVSLTPEHPLLFHPPDSHLDAVLAEKCLAIVDETRRAAMASGFLICLVGSDFGLKCLFISGNFSLHLGEVQTGAGRSIGNMRAKMPVLNMVTP